MYLHFSLQEEDIIEHTNAKYHLCTLQSTCRQSSLYMERWYFLSATGRQLALETPLGSRPIMHAQKSPWTLDAGHVDNLNEGMLLN